MLLIPIRSRIGFIWPAELVDLESGDDLRFHIHNIQRPMLTVLLARLNIYAAELL